MFHSEFQNMHWNYENTSSLETTDDLQTCLDGKRLLPKYKKPPNFNIKHARSTQVKIKPYAQTFAGKAQLKVFPYRCCGVLRLQWCCWCGNRCGRALLWQGLLLLLCRRGNWNWRLDLWRQLCLRRCWSLPLRGVHSLGLWSRWHCLRSRCRGSGGSRCCRLLLLWSQAWGRVVRCWGSARYRRRRISVHGRLWKRWAVNMAPLRTWSHCRRVHRTGSAGHLCLWENRYTFAMTWNRSAREITVKCLLFHSVL